MYQLTISETATRRNYHVLKVISSDFYLLSNNISLVSILVTDPEGHYLVK